MDQPGRKHTESKASSAGHSLLFMSKEISCGSFGRRNDLVPAAPGPGPPAGAIVCGAPPLAIRPQAPLTPDLDPGDACFTQMAAFSIPVLVPTRLVGMLLSNLRHDRADPGTSVWAFRVSV
ncbi:hypothetical protein HDU86_004557 [Geranomyces michiganensis]|nr:hypothetical protein HDU86_004557 [Geranomyces michiganensis]